MSFLFLIFLFLTCSSPVENEVATMPPILLEEGEGLAMKPLVLQECGYNIGDIACGIHARNQDGSWQRLHDYEGKVILLEFGTLWCNFCMTAAFYHKDITKKFSKRKFQWVTVMLENWEGKKPDWIMVKCETQAHAWTVYHVGSREPSDKVLYLLLSLISEPIENNSASSLESFTNFTSA